jgi:hypothetical protein
VEKNVHIERAAEALDQRQGAGVGHLTGKPGLLNQMRGDGAVDNAEHRAHDRRAGMASKVAHRIYRSLSNKNRRRRTSSARLLI